MLCAGFERAGMNCSYNVALPVFWTTETDDEFFIGMWFTAIIIACILGVLLHSVYLSLFFATTFLSTSAGLLIFNYFSTNLLMTTISMPVRAVLIYVTHLKESTIMQPEIERYAHYVFMINLHATYWSWFFLALHRLCNVFIPLYRRHKRFILVKIAFSWLIPIALNAPNFPLRSNNDCGVSPWHLWTCRKCPLDFWLPFLGIYLPFALTSVFYLFIVLQVRKTNQEIQHRASVRTRVLMKKRATSAQGCNAGNGIIGRLSLYFSFLMFYLIPSGIYSATADQQRNAVLELFLSFVFTIPYVINTVVLFTLFKEIRQSVLTAWKRWHRRWLVEQSLIHTL